MTVDKRFITRSIRFPLVLDSYIQAIAEYEGRTVTNTIQRLLAVCASEYLTKHDNDIEFQEILNRIGEEFLQGMKEKKKKTRHED